MPPKDGVPKGEAPAEGGGVAGAECAPSIMETGVGSGAPAKSAKSGSVSVEVVHFGRSGDTIFYCCGRACCGGCLTPQNPLEELRHPCWKLSEFWCCKKMGKQYEVELFHRSPHLVVVLPRFSN